MLDLTFLVVLALWGCRVGLRLGRRLAPLPDHPADALALALPFGLGLLALAVLGLGEVGGLTRGGILLVLGLGLFAAEWRAAGRAVMPRSEAREGGAPDDCIEGGVGGACRSTPAWPDRLLDFALVCVLAGSLLTALAPVTDGDALCYHLQVPKVFLKAGSFGFEPDLHETVYPLVTESLYAAALALRGPVACRLVEWLLGVAFAANVTALARPALGRRARWAGTMALLVPAVSNGMAAPLNDVALAAFGAAALHGWVRWYERPSMGAAALAGGLAGLALGVKYPALVWIGLLGIGMLSVSLRRGLVGQALVFAGAAAAVGGPWYLRALIYTGNPVYPYFRGIFGGRGLDAVLDPTSLPMRVTLPNLLAGPAWMTLEPERFDSFAHQFGPLFLLLLPGLLLWRPPRRVGWLVALGWAFVTLCLTKRQSTRFMLCAVGPWSVGAAWVAARMVGPRAFAGRAASALLAAMLMFEAFIALGHARHGLRVVLGREAAEAYLARREPTYVVGRWIAGNLPATARLVGQDHRGFYIPRPYSMELAHRRRTGLASRGESAEAIADRLVARGFTHLLLCPPVPEDAVEFDGTLGRALAGWLAGREAIYRADLSDADGVVRRYSIYRLERVARSQAAEHRPGAGTSHAMEGLASGGAPKEHMPAPVLGAGPP